MPRDEYVEGQLCRFVDAAMHSGGTQAQPEVRKRAVQELMMAWVCLSVVSHHFGHDGCLLENVLSKWQRIDSF